MLGGGVAHLGFSRGRLMPSHDVADVVFSGAKETVADGALQHVVLGHFRLGNVDVLHAACTCGFSVVVAMYV